MNGTMTVDGSDQRVLVVDDDLSTRLLLETLLEKMKFRVDLARDGSEALDLSSREDFDFTFLDLRMPGVDGLEFLNRNARKPEHLIVFSGASEVEKILPAGSYCGIVPKPFDLELLISQLGVCMNGH